MSRIRQPVIGSELQYRLETLGLSPEEFAVRADVSNMTVRRFESGVVTAPRRGTVQKINSTLARLERLQALREQMEATKETPRWP